MPKIFESVEPVGVIKSYPNVAAAPDGYVFCNGSTIGSGASGATRANAYMQDLFTFLWTNYSNTDLVIQTSAGSNTTRGASAAADFAANKRMPVPNLSRRTLVGAGGSSSGTLGNAVGNQGGEESHTISSGEFPSHVHSTPNHRHDFRFGIFDNGSYAASGPQGALGDGGAPAGAFRYSSGTFQGSTSQTGGLNVTHLNSLATSTSPVTRYETTGDTEVSAPTTNGPSSVSAASAMNVFQPSHVTNFIMKY